MLDTDLARLYGIQTFRLNEAVKRNRGRFPDDFLFQLTPPERAALTSQFAMSRPGRGGRRTLLFAFTEHGALMAANILNSPRAEALAPERILSDHVNQALRPGPACSTFSRSRAAARRWSPA